MPAIRTSGSGGDGPGGAVPGPSIGACPCDNTGCRPDTVSPPPRAHRERRIEGRRPTPTLGGEPMRSSRHDHPPRCSTAVAWASILLATASALGAARASSGAEEDEGRMAAIVAAVRAEEAKYRDLEYTLRITTRK